MNIRIYAIGGNFPDTPSGDFFIGTAHDADTGLSLIHYAEMRGCNAVSLHGDGLDLVGGQASGEFLMSDARYHFLASKSYNKSCWFDYRDNKEALAMKIINDNFDIYEDNDQEFYSDADLVLRGELSSEVGEIERAIHMELVEEFNDECDETYREAA